jgi:hypothetical protein
MARRVKHGWNILNGRFALVQERTFPNRQVVDI